MRLPKSSGAGYLAEGVRRPWVACGTVINLPGGRGDFQPHAKLDELMPVVWYV
jgi:hypothetical protein